MRKLFIIAVLAMFIAMPASGAFADVTATADANATAEATGGSSAAEQTNTQIINMPEQRDVTTVNNNGKGYRGFANPAEISYAPLPGYFGKATRNHNVQSVQDIILIKDTFTRKQCKMALEDVDYDLSGHVGAKAKKDRKDTDTIKVIVVVPSRDTVKQRVIITTRGKTKLTKSIDVLMGAMLTAMNYGSDTLLITAEGAASEVQSFGWGVGLAYTRATINADERGGGVAAGGLGIAGGKAGYKSFPWIQSIGLKAVK